MKKKKRLKKKKILELDELMRYGSDSIRFLLTACVERDNLSIAAHNPGPYIYIYVLKRLQVRHK